MAGTAEAAPEAVGVGVGILPGSAVAVHPGIWLPAHLQQQARLGSLKRHITPPSAAFSLCCIWLLARKHPCSSVVISERKRI